MAIRTVLMERDADTKAQCVLDIREFDEPAAAQSRNWTALAREADQNRRALLLALSSQIDDLLSGRVDEIVLTTDR